MFEKMLYAFLEAQGKVEVVGGAHSVTEGIELCQRELLDLLLLDFELPDGNGLQLVKRLAVRQPGARAILVTERAAAFKCPSKLRQSIYSVVDRAAGVVELMREVSEFHREACSLNPGLHAPSEPDSVLSERELEIFPLVGLGLRSEDIAGVLGRSPLTVETHSRNIAIKLGINRGELVKRAAFHNQVSKLTAP